jgi:hypothetical protein
LYKPLKEPRNRFPDRRNRFLDSINVYKFGLCRAGTTALFLLGSFKYWWLVPLYWIFISHTILMIFCGAHTVVHTIFCLGSCLVGVGLMWTWSLILHWSRIDEFVLGLKSVDKLCHSPPMGIGGADTSQPPKGEICMDKSH